MKRDEIIDKIKNQSFQELNINPALWEKTLEKYAMDNSDEGFNKQLSDLISDFP